MTRPFNIASYLPERAESTPYQMAVVMPQAHDALGRRAYTHLTFEQLNRLCDGYAEQLQASGVQKGERTLLMVTQGLELVALTFALFKVGAVPILIDPGMGVKNFLNCVKDAQPDAMVGVPKAHAVKRVFGGKFKTVKRSFITEPKWWAGAIHLRADFDSTFDIVETTGDDLAAILFTSGSTGPPKGVHYTHDIFDGQTQAIANMYDIVPGEVAVPGFPLFSLFSVAMGMTCVIPEMDPAKPAEVDPRNIVEAIEDFGADMAFGSPAIWSAVARYCDAESIELPSLSRLLTFGAAIHPDLMRQYEKIMPNGKVHTPYGATESLPVASIDSVSVLTETAAQSESGAGICVGHPVDTVDVTIIAIDDGAVATMDDATQLPVGEIGEICASGPTVTPKYDRKPEHNKLSKISDPTQTSGFWHRMGDLGYFDEEGRLWFCGRKAHRVVTEEQTLFSVQCEAVFNNHPLTRRSALIGLGSNSVKVPAIVIEPEPGSDESSLEKELLELATTSEKTKSIQHVFFDSSFPVDKRHNAKIHREELADRFKGRISS